jgi:uncharacterized RDD family membrane protein YckC
VQPHPPLIASASRRFAAAATDLSIASAIGTVAWLAFGEHLELAIGVWFLYQGLWLHTSRGRSPGRIAMGIEVRDAVSYGPITPKQAWYRSAVRPSIFALSLFAAFALPLRALCIEASFALVLLATVGVDTGLLLAGGARQVLADRIAGTVTVFSGVPATQGSKVSA